MLFSTRLKLFLGKLKYIIGLGPTATLDYHHHIYTVLEVKAINTSSLKDASMGVVVADPTHIYNFEQLIFCSSVLRCMDEEHTHITYPDTTKLSIAITTSSKIKN